MLKIKSEDEVIILAGKDRGKRGKVRKVLDNNKVIVSGINMVKKHTKANPDAGVAGGIIENEAAIQISNVAIFNPSTAKADRVGIKVDGDRKVRIFKSSYDYMYYINLDSQGIATYNPPYVQSGSAVSEWSLVGVMFEARDVYDSVVYSYKINFVVKSVSFTVERVDSGEIEFDDPAVFRGQGLPGSTVEALIQQGGLRVNSARVLSDGTWEMEISMNQLNTEGSRNIIFEMDGQVFQDTSSSKDQSWSLRVASDSGETSGMVMMILGVIALIAILAAGAFFFIEFEEFDEEDSAAEQVSDTDEDPYAWAKAKLTPEIPVREVVQQVATAEVSQHPGWLWDAESNQWVPDPNYQAPQASTNTQDIAYDISDSAVSGDIGGSQKGPEN